MQRPPDALQHSIFLRQNFVIPKPQYAETGFFQKRCPFRVAKFCISMLSAIYFDDQFFFQAHEIKYEVLKGMLSPEFVSIKLSAP
jgi:hypothetical protein